MPLPSSGPINFSEVNVELGLGSTAQISLNDATVRTLFQVPSGAIAMSNGYGKSNRVALSQTFATNSIGQTSNIAALPGYVAGSTDVTITVNAGVYVYSTATGTPGLTITGGAAGDTCTLINNGFILGRGGNGGTGSQVGFAGGNALSLGRNVTIQNNSYIAGGGGGGGSTFFQGGGGGAGGGNGGGTGGGAGGAPGAVGGNNTFTPGAGTWSGAGGGGRILPGTGGTGSDGGDPYGTVGQASGGGAGGGGWGSSALIELSPENFIISSGRGGTGGAANNAGQNAFASEPPGENAGGGGGGWGAAR
jgi:hypothetical protein